MHGGMLYEGKDIKLRRVEVLMKLHIRATGCHLPYGITQCYLPPDASERTRRNPMWMWKEQEDEDGYNS